MPFKTCTHVKADGLRCGSPALRGQAFCYFHHHSADHRPRTQARVVQIPFPENAAAIQVGIHNVMLAIIDRRIDERRASQLLWALQIAAGQGRQLPFDNRLVMSQAVTELPDYEVEAEQEAEEQRRMVADLRTSEEQRKQAGTSDQPAPRTAPTHIAARQSRRARNLVIQSRKTSNPALVPTDDSSFGKQSSANFGASLQLPSQPPRDPW